MSTFRYCSLLQVSLQQTVNMHHINLVVSCKYACLQRILKPIMVFLLYRYELSYILIFKKVCQILPKPTLLLAKMYGEDW